MSGRADLEMALLALHKTAFDLHHQADQTPFGIEHFESPAPDGLKAQVVQGTPPNSALQLATGFVDSPLAIDRFGAAQAFVLGAAIGNLGWQVSGVDDIARAHVERHEPAGNDVAHQHLTKAVTLLLPPSGNAARTSDPVQHRKIRQQALHHLSRAFGTSLHIVGDPASGQVELAGPAAPHATLLLELATTWKTCSESSRTDRDNREVTRVEIDVCTNLSFAKCKHGIDPMNWPECNPFFKSVEPIGTPTRAPNGDGWAGQIKEQVGPSLNKGKVYETNLAVRMVEEAGLAAVAFDLAPNFTGDVSVDHGFVSVTDEGRDRRMRVLKVYRIENFPNVPPSWICPLWVWQVALSGWWCG